MNWKVAYLPEAEKDYRSLARGQQLVVNKAIKKVKENPLPQEEGGYGKPLGHKHGANLTGYLKIKLRGEGIRIVYKLIRTEAQMLVVIIGIREDEEVYEIARRRINKHNL
ncbi:MAG: type II toxin-antitoxin system RelE/ParE family toxin [Deltaproteobacteria bacterium]|nr:type II toxin-antitoxin system RelE/ParE family toxin [Deltaproteobacteria bacterium]